MAGAAKAVAGMHNLEVVGSNPAPAMLRLASLAQHKPLSEQASFLFMVRSEEKHAERRRPKAD